MMTAHRTTEQGREIDASILRGFMRVVLEHEAVADTVHNLLHEHVVEGRYHPTVVAASLHPIITDVLDAAADADWQAVADQLVAEAREALGVSERERSRADGSDAVERAARC